MRGIYYGTVSKTRSTATPKIVRSAGTSAVPALNNRFIYFKGEHYDLLCYVMFLTLFRSENPKITGVSISRKYLVVPRSLREFEFKR